MLLLRERLFVCLFVLCACVCVRACVCVCGCVCVRATLLTAPTCMPHERKTARRTDAEWPSSVRTQLRDGQSINSRPPIIAARARERERDRCLSLWGM